MNAAEQYKKELLATLERAFAQTEGIEGASDLLTEATGGGHNIFAFGCSHAGLLALELYYRTGGLATVNPIRAPGLCLDIDPATMTSEMERLPNFGRVIVDSSPMKAGDVIIIHSVSGRNTVTVDVALRAREIGAKVIALTNMAMTMSVGSRHPSGKRLCDCADLVLDNGGCIGDAAVKVDDVPEKVAPTSTAVGAALLNAIVARTVEKIAAKGLMVPVFRSANSDGGDAFNKEMMSHYKNHIFYMGNK